MRRRSGKDDRGTTTIEYVVVMPVVMFALLLAVQTAIWFHGANVAQAAATRGAGAGSARGAGAGAAEAEAGRVVAENGATGQVTSAIDGTDLSVTVVVQVPHLVPFFPDTATRSRREPIERFIPEGAP